MCDPDYSTENLVIIGTSTHICVTDTATTAASDQPTVGGVTPSKRVWIYIGYEHTLIVNTSSYLILIDLESP